MSRQNALLVIICLITATAGTLLALSRMRHEVDFESVVEIWADILRDVDRVGLTVTRVSVKQEMEIGREIEQEIGRYWHVESDPLLQTYVAGVGQTLLTHIQRKGIGYRFYVLDSSVINAYAIPGGGIYLTKGMLDFLESEAELAAILGHEISHVDMRHSIERLQYELAARKIVGKDLALIARIGYTLMGVGFSEQQELEADAGGAILATKARYDPRGGMAVLDRLAKLERRRKEEAGRPVKGRKKPTLMVEELGTALGKALERYFATHPPTDKRIRELTQVLERNARAWRGQKFYVGRSNHRNRAPRSQWEDDGEWRELDHE